MKTQVLCPINDQNTCGHLLGQDLAEYNDAMKAVVELMTTTSTAKLEKYACHGDRKKHAGKSLYTLTYTWTLGVPNGSL